MVEGVSVLLDKTFDLEEGWQKVPFVLRSVNRISQRLVVVERVESGIEAVYLEPFSL